MSIPPASTIPDSIRYLKGVGPKRALSLEKLGVHSVRDLLYFFPRRYEDRSQLVKTDQVTPGQNALVRGQVLAVSVRPIPRMFVVDITVGDDSSFIHAVWFNQPYLKKVFTAGQSLILFGKVEMYQNRLQFSSPEYEILDADEEAVHSGRITPIYPLTEGLFQKSMRQILNEAVEKELDKTIRDYLPETFRQEKNLMPLGPAVREMHFPASFDMQSEARHRIVFDEFFLFELLLLKRVEKMRQKYKTRAFKNLKTYFPGFSTKLPFMLTPSQVRVCGEIMNDLESANPMNRLLQGDVGSGKTVVAAFSLLAAARNGFQGVLLVPTEILAEQHTKSLQNLLEPFQIKSALLTSSTEDNRREKILAELRQGKISVLIGTHALLQKDVQFQTLALVIIDEQHRFGVHQRCALLQREPRPHQLVMTATPIPRTLALTIYGDLDVSVIRELPQGRKPIQTYWVTRAKQDEILKHILDKVTQGEQSYFIFPVIEDTEKTDLLAAKSEYDRLRRGVFQNIKMGLIHGRLASEERHSLMRSFKAGKISILIATSVIEVGMDNPNATTMVIENAERFGLSQLHQMRGRIGRGNKPSECFLFGEPKTEDGQRRLRILTKTQDGFQIAEEDLKLRGPGDFWGTRQSGDTLFRVAHPVLDQEILIEARNTAKYVLQERLIETSPDWSGLKKMMETLSLNY